MSKSLKNTLAKRRLAAIMFTDIAGYTQLMQEDEKKAKGVRNLHREALEEETEKKQGMRLNQTVIN